MGRALAFAGAGAAAVLALTSTSGLCQGRYESPPTFTPPQVLSPDLVQSPYHTVVGRVPVEGFIDRFQMQNKGSFINWLARMAEHRIRDAADYHGAARRDAAREVPIWEDTSGLDRGLTATGLAPLDGAARADDIRRLEEAIERLSPEDLELVIWRVYADADWATVAAETGRASANAARVAFRDTIKRLARLMGGA